MNNTISFKRGQGKKNISDYGDGNQTLRLGEGISTQHVRISEQDNAHLILTLVDDNGAETGDRLTLNYAFILEDSAIERLEFANGDVISSADMLIAAQSDDITPDEAIETTIEDISNDTADSKLSTETVNDTDTSHQSESALRLVVNKPNKTLSVTSDYLNSTDSTAEAEVSYEELWFGHNNQNHLLSYTQNEVTNIESLDVEVSEPAEVIINDDTSFVNWQLEQLVFAMASYDAPAGVGNVIQQDTKDALQSIVVASY